MICDFAQHGGRLVNTIGDGCFVLFESVLRAAKCAIAVQQKITDDSRLAFSLRIGLNTGDADLWKNDAFGDTINLTERIMQKACPGGICMTEEDSHRVSGKIGWVCYFIGEHDLKHIDHPVRLCLLTTPDAVPTQAVVGVQPKKRKVSTALLAAVLVLGITGFIFVSFQVSRSKTAEADRLVALGQTELDKRKDKGTGDAKSYFFKAFKIQPHHALAYAKIGLCHIIKADMSLASGKEEFEEAEFWLSRALEAQSDCADALAGIGYISAARGEDLNHSHQFFVQAMTSDPHNVTAIQWYALTLTAQGKFSQAREEVQKANNQNRTPAMSSIALAFPDYYEGKFDDAISKLREACKNSPSNKRPSLWLGRALTETGDYHNALIELDRAKDFPEQPLSRAYCLASRGGKEDTKEARAILEAAKGSHTKSYASPSLIAKVYCALYQQSHAEKAREDALFWLKTAVEEQDIDLVMMNVDPGYKPIRNRPEFQQILKQRHLDARPE